MEQMELMNLLKKTGFTEYEAKAYIALTQTGEAAVKRIAETSGLPTNKTYEALHHLEKKGFVLSIPVSPLKYRLESLGRLQQQIKQQKKEVQQLEKQYSHFAREITKKPALETAELFAIIRTKAAIERRLSEHNAIVQKEILCCHTFSRDLPTMTRVIEQALKRGVTVKVLAPLTRKNKKIVMDWIRVGAEVRQPKKYPGALRFTIFDTKAVRITIGTPEVKERDDFRTLWIESPSFAAFMKEHFLLMWNEGKACH